MKAKELPQQSRLSASEQERRAFMEKAGKLAVYTPPLMLALLVPSEHAIASGSHEGSGDWPRRRRRRR
jgi:hypothetical protein